MADFETEGGAVVVVGGAVVEVEVELGDVVDGLVVAEEFGEVVVELEVEVEVELGAVVDGLVVEGEFGEVVATGVVPFGAVPAPVRAFDDPVASELRFSVADLE